MRGALMIPFICIFFPPIIATYLLSEADNNKEGYLVKLLYRYAIVSIVVFLFSSTSLLAIGHVDCLGINISDDYSVLLQYLIIAFLISLAIPSVVKVVRSGVKFEIKRPLISNNKLADISLFLFMFFLIALNVIRTLNNNFWGDEAYSILISRQSIFDVIKSLSFSADPNPPLYLLYLSTLIHVFGDSYIVYRMSAMIPVIIVLVFSFTVIKKEFGYLSSMLLMLLSSLLLSSLEFAVQVRTYSLAACAVMISYYGLKMVLNEQKGGVAVFVTSSLIAAYAHIYALFTIAFFYLIILVALILRKIKAKTLLIIYGITFIAYIPWLFQLMHAFVATKNDFWIENYMGVFDSIKYIYSSADTWYSLGMFVITIISLVMVFIKDNKIINLNADNNCMVVIDFQNIHITPDLLWLIGGVLSVFGVISLGVGISIFIRPSFIERYLFPAVPVFWVVLCACVSKLKFNKIILSVLIVLTLIVNIPVYLWMFTEEREDNSLCIETVETSLDYLNNNITIITNHNHLAWTVLDYYYPNNKKLHITNNVFDSLNNNEYVVFWDDDFSEEVYKKLSDNGFRIDELTHEGNLGTYEVHVYRLVK